MAEPSEPQHRGFAKSGKALLMLCRTHGPVAPWQGHDAGARGLAARAQCCPCPALPVPGAAHSPPRSRVEVAFFPGWHLLASWSTKELFSSETLPWYAGIRCFGGLFRLAATVCNRDSIAGDLLFLAPID